MDIREDGASVSVSSAPAVGERDGAGTNDTQQVCVSPCVASRVCVLVCNEFYSMLRVFITHCRVTEMRSGLLSVGQRLGLRVTLQSGAELPAAPSQETNQRWSGVIQQSSCYHSKGNYLPLTPRPAAFLLFHSNYASFSDERTNPQPGTGDSFHK